MSSQNNRPQISFPRKSRKVRKSKNSAILKKKVKKSENQKFRRFSRKTSENQKFREYVHVSQTETRAPGVEASGVSEPELMTVTAAPGFSEPVLAADITVFCRCLPRRRSLGCPRAGARDGDRSLGRTWVQFTYSQNPPARRAAVVGAPLINEIHGSSRSVATSRTEVLTFGVKRSKNPTRHAFLASIQQSRRPSPKSALSGKLILRFRIACLSFSPRQRL